MNQFYLHLGVSMSSYVALYGTVAMVRSYCQSCNGWALVVDNVYLCCDRDHKEELRQHKRASEPEGKRRLPPVWWRRQQLQEQEQRCFYCRRLFGTVIYRQGKGECTLSIAWDHRIPFSLTQNNRIYNFVAACRLCNSFKHKRVFYDPEAARTFLEQRWQSEKYEVIHQPLVRSAENQRQ